MSKSEAYEIVEERVDATRWVCQGCGQQFLAAGALKCPYCYGYEAGFSDAKERAKQVPGRLFAKLLTPSRGVKIQFRVLDQDDKLMFIRPALLKSNEEQAVWIGSL